MGNCIGQTTKCRKIIRLTRGDYIKYNTVLFN